jgi:RNA polymerase sigma-70 factor (ECF subfamily)
MDDRELADRCRRGDRAAWDELVTRYTKFVTFAARKQLRQPTEDLVQDVVQNVFIELLKDERKAWARYDPKYKLTTWLGLVVLTQVERATRGRKLQPMDDRMKELAGEVGAAPDEEAIDGVRRALSALSERERLMVLLYYQDGLGTKEIAATTGVPANTVASHLMRAREKLRKVLTAK